ncbi:MAG: YdeI/OmpD-associated family protein [Chitinophagaceae bacterium]
MAPRFFSKQSEFRNWLQKNHKKKTELLVGFYKVASGRPSITWSKSVDEALCFGWIDGVRTSIDKERYQIRFTPRKSTSIWSAINIEKINQLTKQGLVQPAGLASFEKRIEGKSKIYSHEKDVVVFNKVFKEKFKANTKAWKYFDSLAPSYKKVSTHWVISAKQAATQIKRLNELIADSELGTNKWKNNKYKTK